MKHATFRTCAALLAGLLTALPLSADDALPTFDNTPSDGGTLSSDGAIPTFSDGGSDIPSFGDDSSSSGFSDSSASSSSPISFSGEGGAGLYMFIDDDRNAEDNSVKADPYFKFTISYSGSLGDLEAKINLNEETLKYYNEDILDELTLRAYLGDFVVEAGKMKVVWGKGDKVHVLDNFNSDDYTNFIEPDYIDRRIAIPMVHVAYNGWNTVRLEGVYTPYMVPTRYASSGPWAPTSMYLSAYETAYNTGRALNTYYSSLYPNYTEENAQLSNLLGSNLSDFYSACQDLMPDTKTLKYGQFGFRVTGTVASFDWGASYYFGRYKDPSINSERLMNAVFGQTVDGSIFDYDRLQVFGLEGATVIGGFNLRAEFAYNMTEDFAGDDPYVHNNSIGWVFGFDRDLPWNNLNVNIQTQGSYVFGGDSIKDNSSLDVDYWGEDIWTQDRIVVDLSDSWMNENLKGEVKLVWNIEREDVVVIPSVTYTIFDGLDVTGSVLYIYSGDNGQFKVFEDNSYVQMKAVYKF